MTWYLLDEYPQDRPFVDRCIKCKTTELDRPNAAHRDRVVRVHVDFYVPVGDEFVPYDTPLDFCESCIIEAAAELGMILPEKADALRQKNRQLGAANKLLLEENSSFKKAASAFEAALA